MRMRDFLLLGSLNDHEDVTQQELIEVLLIDANNLVILLNRIEAEGWLVRARDPRNRRRHLVTLTPDGRAAFDKAEQAVGAIEEAFLAPLTAEERVTLEHLLFRIVGASIPLSAS
jgi:DNA-binding MarR family transcriptional regulator